jgi:hypothetical protein
MKPLNENDPEFKDPSCQVDCSAFEGSGCAKHPVHGVDGVIEWKVPTHVQKVLFVSSTVKFARAAVTGVVVDGLESKANAIRATSLRGTMRMQRRGERNVCKRRTLMVV